MRSVWESDLRVGTVMPCYRVPARYHRQDAAGRTVIVDREGPIIDAPTAEDARQKAEVICLGFPDFASIGEPVLIHETHRDHVPKPLTGELRPIDREALPLDDALVRMVEQIRSHRSRRRTA